MDKRKTTLDKLREKISTLGTEKLKRIIGACLYIDDEDSRLVSAVALANLKSRISEDEFKRQFNL